VPARIHASAADHSPGHNGRPGGVYGFRGCVECAAPRARRSTPGTTFLPRVSHHPAWYFTATADAGADSIGRRNTCAEFARRCVGNGIRTSVGRAGVCRDNAADESFSATVENAMHTGNGSLPARRRDSPSPRTSRFSATACSSLGYRTRPKRSPSTRPEPRPDQHQHTYEELSTILDTNQGECTSPSGGRPEAVGEVRSCPPCASTWSVTAFGFPGRPIVATAAGPAAVKAVGAVLVDHVGRLRLPAASFRSAQPDARGSDPVEPGDEESPTPPCIRYCRPSRSRGAAEPRRTGNKRSGCRETQ
jgi:hypothetical protein